jgi:hypothetical protein
MAGGKVITKEIFDAVITLAQIGTKSKEIARVVKITPNTVARIKRCGTWAKWLVEHQNQAKKAAKNNLTLAGLEERVEKIEKLLADMKNMKGEQGNQSVLKFPQFPPTAPGGSSTKKPQAGN